MTEGARVSETRNDAVQMFEDDIYVDALPNESHPYVMVPKARWDRIEAVVKAAREEHDICHGAPRLDAKCSVCSALASLTQETPAQEERT